MSRKSVVFYHVHFQLPGKKTDRTWMEKSESVCRMVRILVGVRTNRLPVLQDILNNVGLVATEG